MNLRETADFEIPSPFSDSISAPGSRTELGNFRVEMLISVPNRELQALVGCL